ncbi:MAG: 3-keto-disaccharide hydrolase, partial [Limisphaerales bacterium]
MRLLNFNARLGGILICIAAGLCASAEEGFIPLFNGQNLDGWDGKPGWWRVEDGAITAESTAEKPCDKHNYLVWRGGEPSDFELRFDYRIVGGNSGVQFRSREIQDWDMRGYQADFFPALANEHFDSVLVTLTPQESARVRQAGGDVAACFETDYPTIKGAEVPDDYLL